VSAFEDLLVVQDHDTAVDQLRHRQATLPERAQLEAVGERLAALEATVAGVGVRRDEIARRQQKLEDELASLEEKLVMLEKRMYSGTVTAPRELQAMQADAESLKRRQSALEDQVLESMGEREPLEEELDGLNGDRQALDEEAGALRVAIAEAEAGIAEELASEEAARVRAATSIPPDLLALYESLRARLGGIGAARLVRGSCTGCHLALPATEVDRIKREPPDAVIRCDQCGRILVR
jgi:predicted  nucleic acid-binding Zn-ribbon protein